MKRLIDGMLLLVLVCSLASCRNDYDAMEDGNHRAHREKVKSVLKTVKMSFGGDYVTESEEPLLRAEGDGDTFVGINVWRTEKGKADVKEEKYAYGLFKQENPITIELWTGYTYRFEATILIEREDKMVLVRSMDYSTPFKTTNGNFNSANMGKFLYPNTESNDELKFMFSSLSDGTANVVIGNKDLDIEEGECWYPRVKRFYGDTQTAFDPETSETVDIPLGFKCFGLKIHVTNLPSGYLTVKDITKKKATPDAQTPTKEKEPREALIFPKNKQFIDGEEWECLYSMNNLLATSETFNLEFVWHKGGNTTEKFESSITVTPGSKKILRLNINGSKNYSITGNINLIKDPETLTADPEVINKDYTPTE